MMTQIVHSRVKIAIYNESVKANLKQTLILFVGYIGTLRSIAETEFAKSIPTFTRKYDFIHYLNTLDYIYNDQKKGIDAEIPARILLFGICKSN